MHRSFVKLNNVPTKVRTWGRWIEEMGPQNEDIVLLIPGNPGLTGYYNHFLERIHQKLNYTCWSVGHAGAEEPNSNILDIPSLQQNEHLYDLNGQVQHKVDFFNKYVPEGSKVHLIGHSIGAYMILQLLKIPEVNAKISHCYLLFPTIEHMAISANGKFFINYMTYIHRLVVLLSYIFYILPFFLQYILIYIFSMISGHSKTVIPATIHLVRPTILSKVFYLAFDEMEKVKDIDLKVLQDNKHKVKLYYAVNDNWVCTSFYKKLIRDHPEIDVEICSRSFEHAFVLGDSPKAGEMVADWISAKA